MKDKECKLLWMNWATTNEHIGDFPLNFNLGRGGVVRQWIFYRIGGVEERSFKKEVSKGVWGMPRLSEAKKDVISCEKLRGSANSYWSVDVRMGQPGVLKIHHHPQGWSKPRELKHLSTWRRRKQSSDCASSGERTRRSPNHISYG